MVKKEIIEILRKYISVLRYEGVIVYKAYLYGSYLNDTAREDSDIDVMIVTDYEDDNLVGKVWNLTKRVSTKIEPYLVGNTRFNSSHRSPLIDLVKASGLEIV